MRDYMILPLLVLSLFIFGTSKGNHIRSEPFFIDDLSGNRTSVRNTNSESQLNVSGANTRRGNTEIPGNVNIRRPTNEIQESANNMDTFLFDDLALPTNSNVSQLNGRIEGTNRLDNRVTDAAAPDGSSVILTPVQEGAVQSLRTMLQSGQTRGTPRLIGFLIPTSDGRTRLRLMPGQAAVNREGMPLNLRTIVAAARRANLLPTNSTTQARTQTGVQQRRPQMVVLRPRTSPIAIDETTRTRQLQNRLTPQTIRLGQGGVQRQQNSETGVDQVEVTINTNDPLNANRDALGEGTFQQEQTQARTPQTNSARRTMHSSSLQTEARNRFMDTVRTLRQNQMADLSDRRINELDRTIDGTPLSRHALDQPERRINALDRDTISSRNAIDRGNNDVGGFRQGSSIHNARSSRTQETGLNSAGEAALEPVDLFNTPRTVNLIGGEGNSNGQLNDQGRKVSVTINTNNDLPNDRGSGMHSRNNMQSGNRDVPLFDEFQNIGERNQFNMDGHSKSHNLLRPVQPQTFDHNTDFHNQHDRFSRKLNDAHGFHDHPDHGSPTFTASASNSNPRDLPHIDRQHFDFNSQQHQTLQHQSHDHTQNNGITDSPQAFNQLPKNGNTQFANHHNDLLNDRNLQQIDHKQVSQLSIHDLFPGLQFSSRQQTPTRESLQSNAVVQLHQNNPDSSKNLPTNTNNLENIPHRVSSEKIPNFDQPITQNPDFQNLLQNLISQHIQKLLSANTGTGAVNNPAQQINNQIQTVDNSVLRNMPTMNSRFPVTSNTRVDQDFLNQQTGHDLQQNQLTPQSILTSLLQTHNTQTQTSSLNNISPLQNPVQGQGIQTHPLQPLNSLQGNTLNQAISQTNPIHNTPRGNADTQTGLQNNLISLLQGLLHNTGSLPLNDIQTRTNQLLDNANPVQNPKVVNIQMQNALQPHDFGISGGHEISHANALNQHHLHQFNPLGTDHLGHHDTSNNMSPNIGQQTIAQLTNLLSNNPSNLNSLLQTNSIAQNTNPFLPNSFQRLASINNLPNNMQHQITPGTLLGAHAHNTIPSNVLLSPINSVQNTLTPNQRFRELLQQNIQQILMQQNNQLSQSSNILGTQGFFGLNKITKSFPNDQLAPSDTIQEIATNMTQKNTSSLLPKLDSINPTIIATSEPFMLSQNVSLKMPDNVPIDALNNSVTVQQHIKVDQPTIKFESVALNGSLSENITLSNIVGSSSQNKTSGQFTDIKVISDNVTNAANAAVINKKWPASNNNLTNKAVDSITATNIIDKAKKAQLTANDVTSTSAVLDVSTTTQISTEASTTQTTQTSTVVSTTVVTTEMSTTNPPTDGSTTQPNLLKAVASSVGNTTGTQLPAMDIGLFTNAIKKSIGVKSVDRATLKGVISNVLRDLFKQNFIDPVKGTLKSSLNYTTMLTSVKKVLMKSKDKLLRLKERIGTSPTQLPNLMHLADLHSGNIAGHTAVDATTFQPLRTIDPLPVTPFTTTQPVTIKQPTLEPPTPAPIIVDSIGNQGVITNQNFGTESGGGVAVWNSKIPPHSKSLIGSGISLSNLRQFQLSKPVLQPSGDLSVVGMANPTDIGSLPVTLSPVHFAGETTTKTPTTSIGVTSTFHTTDPSFGIMSISTQSSHLINIGKNNIPSINANLSENTSKNSTDLNTFYINTTLHQYNTNLTVNNITLNGTSNAINVTSTVDPEMFTTTTHSTTPEMITTTTQSVPSTTILHEDSIRMPNGTIISMAQLESMDPEQAEIIAEMSEIRI